MKRPSGKHIHKTHTTAGIPKGGGDDPRNTPLGSHGTTTQIQTTKEDKAVRQSNLELGSFEKN